MSLTNWLCDPCGKGLCGQCIPFSGCPCPHTRPVVEVHLPSPEHIRHALARMPAESEDLQ